MSGRHSDPKSTLADFRPSCSFLRFLLRAFVQFVLLTPKPSIFPDAPHARPLGMILGTNLVCLLSHAYFSRPEAGEATRGYLHGGLAMDFIGQKGPISKTHLLVLDLLVLLLQLVNLGVVAVKKKASAAAEAPVHSTSTTTRTAGTRGEPVGGDQQTLDDEERGQLRSDHQPVDIELQDLNPSTGAAANNTSATHEEAGEGESC